MYVDFVVNARRNVRICRREECESTGATKTLARAARLAETVAATFGVEVESVDVSECSSVRFAAIRRRAVYFVNICGKITHYAGPVHNAGVLPLTVQVANNFGRGTALYGPECNLLTSSTGSVTIFRAARDSQSVQDALGLALSPDSVARCDVHMMVASARLAQPVCLQSAGIDEGLQTDARWTAESVVKTEDGMHIKSVRLGAFDAAWMASLGAALVVPSSMLVNVTKNGSVNMFMSVRDTFRVGVEHEYRAVYEAVVAVVAMHS